MAIRTPTEIEELRRRIAELEYALQHAEGDELLRVLGRNVPGIMYLCRNDERYSMLYLNDAVGEMLGIPAEDFLKDRVSFVELYHPEDTDRIAEEVDAALADQRQFRLVYRLRHVDGHYVWVEELGQGVFDEHGELRFLEGTVFDISHRVAVQLELETRVQERTAELARVNDALRAEIDQRAETMQKLRREERLSRKLLDLQERERKLIAYEIHDGFLQDVVGAQMLASNLRERLDEDGLSAEEELDKISRLLRKALGEGRQLISELRPIVIDERGILEAIQYLVEEVQTALPVKLTFEAIVSFERLPPLLEGALFRIVQEAVGNIGRHSDATEATIRLVESDEVLILEVSDNGQGFHPHQVPEEHFGLEGIRRRALLFQGQAHIDSSPGHGTRVRVEIPLGSLDDSSLDLAPGETPG